MGLVDSDLADAITLGLGQSLPHSAETLGFATGILNELRAATAGFGGMSPGPYSISGMSGSSMATRVKNAAGYPSVSAELTSFCQAISDAVALGIVVYTGPGPVFFLGGTISGISGSSMASAAGFPSVTSQVSGMCGAIATYINSNASVTSGVIS
jgi:hypothetical protein